MVPVHARSEPPIAGHDSSINPAFQMLRLASSNRGRRLVKRFGNAHRRHAFTCRQCTRALSARPPETEMERGLKRFGFLIMQLVFFLVIFVFFINALYRHSVLESLLFAVALAVGITPELLPMILSLNLSRGAMAMSGKGVIVKDRKSVV